MRKAPLNLAASNAGISLIGVLIAVGLLPVLIFAGLQVFDHYNKSLHAYIAAGGEEDIRNYIRAHLDCRATMQRERSACDAGRRIQGYNKNAVALIADASVGRKFKDATVKLKCTQVPAGGYDITAQVSHAGGAEKELFKVPIACSPCGPDPGWGDPQTLPFGTPSSHNMLALVQRKAAECGMPAPTHELTRTTGAPERAIQVTASNQGVEHLPTLTQVCRLLGYDHYVSSNCWDSERSGRYPFGKCNWHSNNDDNHSYYNGTAWVNVHRPYYRTWIASITCSGLN